jgi:hypothetical protein
MVRSRTVELGLKGQPERSSVKAEPPRPGGTTRCPHKA